MGRRIRWIGLVMIVCFTLVMVQLVNIQFRKQSALATSAQNPRNPIHNYDNDRGFILASDGSVLAESLRVSVSKTQPYQYVRVYPGGSLYSQVVGYSSIFYGTSGVEYQYNQNLVQHTEAPQTFAQALGLDPKPTTTDDVTLTIVPALQKVAEQALSEVPGAVKDGAVVALNPKTGAVEAMYSSPSYNPNQLSSLSIPTAELAYSADQVKDSDGFRPLRPIATQEFFPPGSTSKVLTTAAVYDLKGSLDNYQAPYQLCTTLPDSNKPLCGDGSCGGPISEMLPVSCDPGYGDLGLALGGNLLTQQATDFGYNSVPPIDLGPGVIASSYPSAADLDPTSSVCDPNPSAQCYGLPGVAYASIGQQSVDTTALQNALVASAIANRGVIMTPHVMAQIRDSAGNIVSTYQPSVWKTATTPQTAAALIPLMESVATRGTADGVGFPRSLDVAVKTGTAQTGNSQANTDDWMIGFAPASDPVIAVAVVVPNEPVFTDGAEIAGPVMKAILTEAVALANGTGSTTSTTAAPKVP
jgi:peptidoglycan glycosyltransferase